MREEEPLSYKFKFDGGWDNVYSFTTLNRIDYVVRFKPCADYFLPQEIWRDTVFEIVIEVVHAPNPARIPADRSIFPTIAAIITTFFGLHNRVILYICDDADAREMARKRKFDAWYDRLNGSIFEKYDLPTLTDGPERYVASVIFLRTNPHRVAIITAFNLIASGEK